MLESSTWERRSSDPDYPWSDGRAVLVRPELPVSAINLGRVCDEGGSCGYDSHLGLGLPHGLVPALESDDV